MIALTHLEYELCAMDLILFLPVQCTKRKMQIEIINTLHTLLSYYI